MQAKHNSIKHEPFSAVLLMRNKRSCVEDFSVQVSNSSVHSQTNAFVVSSSSSQLLLSRAASFRQVEKDVLAATTPGLLYRYATSHGSQHAAAQCAGKPRWEFLMGNKWEQGDGLQPKSDGLQPKPEILWHFRNILNLDTLGFHRFSLRESGHGWMCLLRQCFSAYQTTMPITAAV